AAAGITELIINHAWLGARIEQALGNGKSYGVRIAYSAETQALETAGGIAQALHFFENQPFLVVNGDVWCDWNPAQAESIATNLLDQHKMAWLLMVENPVQHPKGDFQLNTAGLILDKDPDNQGTSLTFSGIGIYHPALFQGVQPGQPARLAPLLRHAMSSQQISGSRYQGAWVDVGTPERLAALDRQLSGG